MDSFSLFPLLAQAATSSDETVGAAAGIFRQFFPDQSAYGIGAAVGAIVRSIFIQILAYWVAAKVVVGNEKATLNKAAYLWLLSVLVGIGMGVLLVVCMMLAATTQQSILMMLVGGGWLLLGLALALLLPAKVFETGLLRALGVVVLSSVLVLAAQTAIDQIRGQSTLARWEPLRQMIFDSPEGRQRRLKGLIGGDQFATIENDLDRLSSPAERSKTFTERQEALRTVFTTLEQKRKTLKASDREAFASYDAARQRYEALVTALRADYAASQAPRPGTTPAAR